MKVKVVSDLHLEFDDPSDQFDIGSGDVLVLAGDICVVSEFPLYRRFFNQCLANYNKVIYIMGNHELYQFGDIRQSYYELKSKLPEGITLLHNNFIVHEGVMFVGGTLWTNQGNLNFETMKQSQDCMNDYYSIKNDGRDLTVLDTIEEHFKTKKYLETVIPRSELPVFVVTHHAPSQRSIRGRYTDNRGAYGNDLEDFIENNPQITHWVHGHAHVNNNYLIGTTRVISNPRGYNGMELNPDFDPDLSLTVV